MLVHHFWCCSLVVYWFSGSSVLFYFRFFATWCFNSVWLVFFSFGCPFRCHTIKFCSSPWLCHLRSSKVSVIFSFPQQFCLEASSTSTLPTIRHTARRTSSNGSVFPNFKILLLVSPTSSETNLSHRMASPERPRTQLIACKTITQTSRFCQAATADPSGYAHYDFIHKGPWLPPLGVPRGSGHTHLVKSPSSIDNLQVREQVQAPFSMLRQKRCGWHRLHT